MDTYSLNPVIFPQKTPLPANHHRTVVGAIVLAVLAAAIAIIYWGVASQRTEPLTTTPPIDGNARIHAEIATILRNSSATRTNKDVEDIATSLSTSKMKVNESDKADIINSLNTPPRASIQNY